MDSQKENTVKNKFRVASFLPAILVILLAVCMIGYMCFVVSEPEDRGWEMIVLTVMLFLLPISLQVWGIIIGCPIVTIDEKGLHKALFGKFLKKSILWEEVKHIYNSDFMPAGRGAAVIWVFFSKVNLEGKGITRCRLRRDNIYLIYSNELQEAVKFYGGVEIPLRSIE